MIVFNEAPAEKAGARRVSPEEFYRSLDVGHSDAIQCLVFQGRGGAPNDHQWNMGRATFATGAAENAKQRKPAYFSIAGYKPDAVSRYGGRTAQNVVAVRCVVFDVEGSPEKYAKPNGPNEGYPDGKTTGSAALSFIKSSGLIPNFMIQTGSGGLHLYFVLAEPLTRAEWQGRALASVELAAKHGLKIDAQCTTDAARIMRAPGSIHQKTGVEVTATALPHASYTLAEFDRLVEYTPGAVVSLENVAGRKYNLSVNDDVKGSYPKFSYQLAAEKCPAMRRAAVNHGAETPYPVWILAARAASLSVEGAKFAHNISAGHPDYDEAETDKKLNSLTGGPANCDTWANAYGPCDTCDTCEYRGKITNPAIQLGAVVNTAVPGELAVSAPETLPVWVLELNKRFAVLHHGSKCVVVDFQTPSISGMGISRGVGFMDFAAFRAMHSGQFAPINRAGDKQRALADAWLSHLGRRQYDGLVFAPGRAVPDSILNMWQGFAVDPVAGDVSPWLEVLAALVPKASDQAYVLRWYAWKVQNPGSVPDTILIFHGAKGTGKGALHVPLLALFGRHAMLADDPELIAGRFTWHLMTLAFAVLDEAIFVGDMRQADRIKSRVTARAMTYEQKGFDPVQGLNQIAFVMLTNHGHNWQATTDERRAVVLEVSDTLRGNLEFWTRYHAWAEGPGPSALLHYLLNVDLTGFNPRAIPKGEALRRQVELTALRDPAAAWWFQCLTEGAVQWRDGLVRLNEDTETEVDRAALRQSFEQSASGQTRYGSNWAAAARKLNTWAAEGGPRSVRVRVGAGDARGWREVMPPLAAMRARFTEATQIEIPE